jgi:hypothetical protein
MTSTSTRTIRSTGSSGPVFEQQLPAASVPDPNAAAQLTQVCTAALARPAAAAAAAHPLDTPPTTLFIRGTQTRRLCGWPN